MENEIVYRNSKLPSNAFLCFQAMRHRGEFCDVMFNVGDYSVFAHRIVVLSTMPGFHDVFSNKKSNDVSVLEVDPYIFESLIDYAYTSTVKITTENVTRLLSAACRLGMEEVWKACCEFIAYDGLHQKNILSFLDLAQAVDCSELLKICQSYVKENFLEISETEEFLKLDFLFLKDVLDSDELVVVHEEKVYEAVIKWTKYSLRMRETHLPYLLRCVRMPLLDTQYLRNYVAKEGLIRKSMECRDLLDEAKDYHYEPSARGDIETFSTQLRSYHPCRKSEESEIYAVSAELSLKARQLDTKSGCWSDKKNENFKICGDTSVVTLQDKVYFFNWNKAWFYSPLENALKSTSRFVHGRAIAVLNNKLYSCGGSDGYSISKVAECFDPLLEEWNEINTMRQCRTFAGAAALGECIYVLGGENNEGILNTVEKYNIGIQMWTSAEPMLTHRKKFSTAALDGKLYACGGITTESSKCIATAEVYDPIRKQWKYISSLNSARCLLTLVSFQGKLQAVGGKDDSENDINQLEIWDSDADKWSYQ